MKGKVNKCNFIFFSSADWRDSMKKWNAFRLKKEEYFKYKHRKSSTIDTEIAAYFDEIDDEYRVCIVGTYGDIICKNVYSWDELSAIIHDNI